MSDSPYLHVLAGRLRTKVLRVQGAPLKAREVEQAVRRLDGITQVTANPITGNVLIEFNSQAIDPRQILAILNDLDGLERNPAAARRSSQQLWSALAQYVLASAVETAATRLLRAAL
jgi:hypothetical protein